MNASSTISPPGHGNCVDTVAFRLAFSGALFVSVVGLGCARPSAALVASARISHAFVSEGDDTSAPTVHRARVSVADTTSATVAPVRDPTSEDGDDFDEMPFVRAPSIEELGDANAVKHALRLLRWIAPSSEQELPADTRAR